MDEVYDNIEKTNTTISTSAESMHTVEQHLESIVKLSNSNDKSIKEVEQTMKEISSSSKELMATLDNFKT
jgi:methyl-accepting chemotaxis protein